MVRTVKLEYQHVWSLYKMSKDVYLKSFSDGSWELYNKDSLELCSNSYETYLTTFIESIEDIDFSKELNVLIVGGGDKQICNYLSEILIQGSSITLVDPLIGQYDHYEHLYSNLSFPLDDVEYIPQLFGDCYLKLKSKNKFDLVIVDCSEEIIESTNEIYTKDFLIAIKSLINNNGDFIYYLPPKINNIDFRNCIDKHFAFDSSISSYIYAWEEDCTFVKLNPLNLIANENNILQHVHYHADFVFNLGESEHLNNINHEIMYDCFFNIVSKYCNIMKSESFPFKTGGYSGSFILGESHFNWHSFPENNLLTIDLYHCKYNKNLINIFEEIKSNFSIESIKNVSLTENIFNPLDMS